MIKLLKNIFPFEDFVYLLQLENYETKRYFKDLERFLTKRNFQIKGKLEYTVRAKVTLMVSILFFLLSIFIILKDKEFMELFFLIALCLAIPYLIALTNLFLFIPYKIIEKLKIKDSKFKIKIFKGKVIVITGSFGKTTLRSILYELIKPHFKVQTVEGNINTQNGIAKWILETQINSEYLLIEVDPYREGEIQEIISFTGCDIGIITNIGDQHLERLKDQETQIKAFYEIVKYSNPKSVILVTDNIKNKFDSLNLNLNKIQIPMLSNRVGFHQINREEKSLNNLKPFVFEIANLLGIEEKFAKYTLENFKLIDRRGDIKKTRVSEFAQA